MPVGHGYNYFLACDTAERIVFTIVTGSGSGKLCRHSRGNDNDQENAGYVRESAGGSEQVLRLRARDGAFRAPARVTFFFCQKKVTKEKHSNLRFKDPLARYGSCKIGVLISRNWYGGYRCRFGGLLVPPAPLPLTTARVGAGTLVVFGDYQIAPIAARSTAMGRWRLTPPGYGGTCLPAGRSAGLTVSFNTANPPGGRLGRCGGRREKHLPWLGQAAAEASAPVSVHAVLLTDNGDERLCPREYAGNHCRP